MMNRKRVIIIGGGLSGLYCAYLLQKTYDVIVLEAKGRLGGRIQSSDKGGDLGPTWIWPHHRHMLELIQQFGLPLFLQYTEGDALYDDPRGIQRFKAPSPDPSGRIDGGVMTIIDALASSLRDVEIKLNHQVRDISYDGSEIKLSGDGFMLDASHVIVAIPPRVALDIISYQPNLSPHVSAMMKRTPTWMGNSAKAIIYYKEPFWRENGLSGLVISHLGPLSEIHDACNKDHNALFGFFHSSADTEMSQPLIYDQMKRLFGPNAPDPLSIEIKDWKRDPFATTEMDHHGLYAHPDYGLDVDSYDGTLIFAGTEYAFQQGGYLEGALMSAIEAAQKINQKSLK